MDKFIDANAPVHEDGPLKGEKDNGLLWDEETQEFDFGDKQAEYKEYEEALDKALIALDELSMKAAGLKSADVREKQEEQERAELERKAIEELEAKAAAEEEKRAEAEKIAAEKDRRQAVLDEKKRLKEEAAKQEANIRAAEAEIAKLDDPIQKKMAQKQLRNQKSALAVAKKEQEWAEEERVKLLAA